MLGQAPTAGPAVNLTLNGGSLQAGGSSLSASRDILFGTGGGKIDVNGYTVTVPGSISGSGGLNVVSSFVPGGGLSPQGAGTLLLTGTNSYSGGATISAGTLTAVSTAALPGYAVAGSVYVGSGATLAVYPTEYNPAVGPPRRLAICWSAGYGPTLAAAPTSASTPRTAPSPTPRSFPTPAGIWAWSRTGPAR